MAVVMKVGAWGAPDGSPQDINAESRPQRLESITIYSVESPGVCGIKGFSFKYVDQQGSSVKSAIWGSNSGNPNTIEMREGEQLKLVGGTFDNEGIGSLTLETNTTKHKTYGYPVQGGEFSLPLPQGKGELVAFFGRSDVTLKALGVYVKGSPAKVGKWGAKSGAPRDIRPDADPCKLESFTIHSSERIHGFSFTYLTKSGQAISVPLWGKKAGEEHTIFMNQSEYVSSITGAYDTYGITFLNFDTNQGASHTFGRNPSAGTKTFSVPLPDNGALDDAAAVAFFGSSGDSLVAIGAYVGVAPE
uniref:Jacalin-like protein LEM2 n=1 Tax=Hordeum vulgare subsp. vulgare TaxID=112509 RepID=Q8L8I5_HORVV|nr:jacalin-like protein LEM2 [Hordeum vulgare subsp. vulgare]